MGINKQIHIITIIIIILGIVGLIAGHNIKKSNLRQSIIGERELSAQSIEKDLPLKLVNQFDYISDASVRVDLVDYEHKYTDYEGKPACYIQWEDNITLICIANDSFNRKTDSAKLECFKNITKNIKDEAAKIQKECAPIYDDYYSRSEIVDVFEEGVFCQRNVKIYLAAGSEEYSYDGNNWHISEAFKHNGIETDLTPRPSSSTNGPSVKTTNNVNANKETKKKKSKSYYEDDYPDCDDYEDWEEFMDDWDGDMPGDSDASDYWDDW